MTHTSYTPPPSFPVHTRSHRPVPSWLRESLPAVIFFVIALIPFLQLPTIWDGRLYEDCAIAAARSGFHLESLLCFGHPSFLYMGIYGLADYLPGTPAFQMHLFTLAGGIASIAAFAAICRKLLPTASALTRILATMLYATQPVILVNATTVTLDNGIVQGFVILLALLLYGHIEWAAAMGIALTFTKETGLLLYCIAAAAYWIALVRPHHASTPAAARSTWLRIVVLMIPALLFAAYRLSVKTLFEGRDSESVLQVLTTVNLTDSRFLHMMAEIFVFQFTWVQTAVILIAALLWLWKWDRGTMELRSNEQSRMTWFLIIVYAAGTYALTRYIPYNNLRYLMMVYPVGSLLFTVSAVWLLRGTRLSNVLLAAAVALQVLAIFTSVDPVSRAIYGTFDFGARKMYPLGKIDNLSCCMRGRDQIVYNFQHLKLVTMQEPIMEHIRPSRDTVISTHPEVSVGFNDGFLPDSFQWTREEDAIFPLYRAPADVIRMEPLPREVWYIEYPNFDNAEGVATLGQKYSLVSRTEVREGAYVIPVDKFELR